MLPSLSPDVIQEALGRLRESDRADPEPGGRQPVHTVYGGGHLFRSDSAVKLGRLAVRSLEEYAPCAADLAFAMDLPEALAAILYTRVTEKLRREPVEDFRIDFEDGYGSRPDAEEDGHVEAAAREVAAGMEAGTLPPFLGLRIKSFAPETRERAVRSLDLFVTTLAETAGGRVPAGFVVTLPKVTRAEEVATLADLLGLLERRLALAAGSLALEVMVETPRALFDRTGHPNLSLLVAAARGRCVAAHFGTYDYTAGLEITAAHQALDHPACDFARHMMQVSLAGTGVRLSDSVTTAMPIPPHRAAPDGPPLDAMRLAENHAAVHRAWKIHYDNVRRSLARGFYQSWDLHPGQLIPRYAAVYAFFLEGLDAASERLRNFVRQAAQATQMGGTFDDAATGQGLLNYFLRAVGCGAISEEEAVERSGLTLGELRSRSFGRILDGRRKGTEVAGGDLLLKLAEEALAEHAAGLTQDLDPDLL